MKKVLSYTRLGLVWGLIAALVVLPGVGEAFNAGHLAQLKATNSCPNCDLSGATWTDGRQCKDGSIGECK